MKQTGLLCCCFFRHLLCVNKKNDARSLNEKLVITKTKRLICLYKAILKSPKQTL